MTSNYMNNFQENVSKSSNLTLLGEANFMQSNSLLNECKNQTIIKYWCKEKYHVFETPAYLLQQNLIKNNFNFWCHACAKNNSVVKTNNRVEASSYTKDTITFDPERKIEDGIEWIYLTAKFSN
jgi:hypothetical protein